MIKLIEWLLGTSSGPCVQDKLAKLDVQRAEAEELRDEARRYRTRAERAGREQKRRLIENHFGEGMIEALHQRGWTQQ
ncbi:MAG TPA: hypothetical protein VIM60_10390 [Edaphobacter sp.]